MTSTTQLTWTTERQLGTDRVDSVRWKDVISGPAPRTPEYESPHTSAGVAIITPMALEQLSDEELIANCRAATSPVLSRQYVDEAFRRNHPKIARWCFRFTRDRDSAADLAQEICAKAYQNLASFQNQSKFSTWLFSIARNHCINALRARSSQPTFEGDEEIVTALPDRTANGPEESLVRQYDARLVRELLNEALDETEKVVFTLHFGEELSLDAITKMLALENASGAKAYIVSAKRKLARVVERWKARNARANR